MADIKSTFNLIGESRHVENQKVDGVARDPTAEEINSDTWLSRSISVHSGHNGFSEDDA